MNSERVTREVTASHEALAFQRWEDFYSRIRGAGVMPIGPNGQYDYERARQIAESKYGQLGATDAMVQTTLEYHLLSTGELVPLEMYDRNPILLPPQLPTSYDFTFGSFAAKKPELTSAHYEVIDRLGYAKKVAGKKKVYAPIYDSNGSQLTVEKEWRRQREILLDEVNNTEKNAGNSEKLQVVKKQALITGSLAGVYLTPMSIPVSTEKDDTAEVGGCNQNYIGSPIKGEKVRVLAERGAYAYITTAADFRGWIHKKDIGMTTGNSRKTAHEYTEIFYAEGIPLQYRYNGSLRALRSGDSVFEKEGALYTAESDASGNLVYHEVSELDNTSCVKRLSSSQEFVDFLYRIRESYKWGDMDCAKVVSRALRMAGERVPGAASDIVDHFLHKQGRFDLAYQRAPRRQQPKLYEQERQKHFLTADGFDALKPGVYFADMGPMLPNGNYSPRHGMIIIVGENNEFEGYSMAYRFMDGKGNVRFPLGPTVSDKAALEYYQKHKGDPKWKFRVVQIAGEALHPREEYEAV